MSQGQRCPPLRPCCQQHLVFCSRYSLGHSQGGSVIPGNPPAAVGGAGLRAGRGPLFRKKIQATGHTFHPPAEPGFEPGSFRLPGLRLVWFGVCGPAASNLVSRKCTQARAHPRGPGHLPWHFPQTPSHPPPPSRAVQIAGGVLHVTFMMSVDLFLDGVDFTLCHLCKQFSVYCQRIWINFCVYF